jgi:pyruvate/2-oxoglutarate dehydrogenase complex dihydrolipoamide acyltransferase (E2) component
MRMHRVTGRSMTAVLALLGAGGMSLATADPPSTPDAAAPAASATSTAAVTPPAAPAAANVNAPATAAAKPVSATTAEAGSDAAFEKKLTNSGYKSRMRNGTRVWCKRQDELGSRLGAQEVCATPDEWRQTFRENQDVVEHIQKIDGHTQGR